MGQSGHLERANLDESKANSITSTDWRLGDVILPLARGSLNG
jgi:hypothetical protein